MDDIEKSVVASQTAINDTLHPIYDIAKDTGGSIPYDLLYRSLVHQQRHSKPAMQKKVADIFHSLAIDKSEPIYKAAISIATVVGDKYFEQTHDYVDNVVKVAQAEGLDNDKIAETVLVACAHSLGDISFIDSKPFAKQRKAFNVALPYMKLTDVPVDAIHRIGDMLLSTDLANGKPKVDAAYVAAPTPASKQRAVVTDAFIATYGHNKYHSSPHSYKEFITAYGYATTGALALGWEEARLKNVDVGTPDI